MGPHAIAVKSMRGALAILLCALAGSSCGSDGTVAPEPVHSLQIVSGANATDTIEATLAQPLVVQVMVDSGKPAPAGTVVRFVGFFSTTTEVRTYSSSFGFFAATNALTTDENGQVSVQVKVGQRVGTARLIVHVPVYGLLDTARFTVTVGNPAAVKVAPTDTTLYVDSTYALVGTVTDRAGNARPEAVTWSTAASGATVTPGGSVKGTGFGRFTFTATAGALTKNSSLSVVPRFKVAASKGPFGSQTILSMEFDGTHQRVLGPASESSGVPSPNPVWLPGTSSILYSNVISNQQYLHIVADSGPPGVAFIGAPPGSMTGSAAASPTADGNWVYFSALDSRCVNANYCLFRAPKDGSSVQLITTAIARHVAARPDGSRIAVVDATGFGDIKTIDPVTGVADAWKVQGMFPAWSPDGTKIAYVNTSGHLSLMNADGTGRVELNTSPVTVARILHWSPDGKWIVANVGPTSIGLVDATTGTLIPLPYAVGFTSMDLR